MSDGDGGNNPWSSLLNGVKNKWVVWNPNSNFSGKAIETDVCVVGSGPAAALYCRLLCLNTKLKIYNFDAEACSSYNIGGMGLHWTNRTPRPYDDELNKLFDIAEWICNTNKETFNDSLRGQVLRDELNDISFDNDNTINYLKQLFNQNSSCDVHFNKDKNERAGSTISSKKI